ncbi:MAG: TonB-dependent receptor [Acidobacteriaceae bacterium]|nr:TonB-dependent receptor [Acidobacteriaceae bacterium]
MNKKLCLWAVITALFVLPWGLLAQATSGTILGTVLDPSGTAVPGATVTIDDVGKGTTQTVETNESGNYTVGQLTPGTYRVTVNRPGFRRFVQENVSVGVAQSSRVDATLQIGEASQEVTVTDAPPSIQTDRAEVQTSLTSGQISSLPVLNRNFTNLTLLTPGSVINTYQHAPSENPQQSTLVNTNGQLFAGTNYQLDGMNNNDSVLGITMVNPTVDSVGTFTASTSNYDAEYGATGAVINVETKSGTNDFHGSAFEFLQNNIFQARDPFSQGLHDPGTPAPPNRGIPALRWNQFGGSLGGPIKKDKLFFFGDYQGTQRRMGASQSLRVPTASERTGNLSDLGVRIYDPNSGNADGTGRTLFPNATIPTGFISTPATNILNALPLPNIPAAAAGLNNYATSVVETYNTNQFNIRADHYVTDKLKYFGRYSYLQANIVAPGPFGLYGGTAFPALGFSGTSDALNQNIASNVIYSFSPTLVGDIRFGFSRYRVNVGSLDANTQLANTVGIPGLNINGRPDTNGLPQLNIMGNGGFNLGYNCNCPLLERETLLDFQSNWTKTAGNHTIKWGGTFELAYNQRLPSDGHRSGVYNFETSVTSLNGDPNSGLGLASFLLGAPSSFNRFGQISTTQEDRQNRMFYYAQDTWRITPKLTLNIGVRWDTWFPDFSKNAGQGGRYDVVTNEVLIPGVGGVSLSGNSQTQWTNFAPRFGIAYAPDTKTVIRTGYGRGYSIGTFGWTFNNIAADIYPSIVNQTINPMSPYQPVFRLTTAPPPIVYPTIPPSGRFPLPDGIGTPYIPPNQKIPYVDQWNFTVEREIVPTLNLSVGYVGNIARHLNGGFNLNSAIPGPGPLNPRRPLYNEFGITQNIFDKCNCTSGNYNGLQAQASKRFTRGYSLQTSFTWSKALNYGEFGTPTNQYNVRSDYGPASFDREFVYTLAHTLELPFGPGHKFLSGVHGPARLLVEGWSFRGITSYNSGLPFSPGFSNTPTSLNSDMSTRPDQIGDPLAGVNQSRNLWFNPAVYVTPGLYTFGNAGKNSLRGPGFFEADWSLGKAFRVRERYAVDLRWEVFNALNNTNLALPNSNVDSGAAGVIQGISFPKRNMQLGAHIQF